MPVFAFVGRMFGAPGRAPFAAAPAQAEARALIDAGPGDNVAVTDAASPTSWLHPTVLPHPLEQAHARVLGAIGLLRGWALAGDSPDVVWATRTTPVLGFVDDVIILLTPRGPGTVVEARSASRVGQGDMGRNRSTLRELADVLSRWA